MTVFIDYRQPKPNPKTGVHIVFAGEKVKPHSLYPAPDVAAAVRSAAGFWVLDLPALVAMKLEAFRDIDRVHIRDLLAVALIDAALIERLPADLQRRMREIETLRE